MKRLVFALRDTSECPSNLLGLAVITIVPESAIVDLKCSGFDQMLEAWDADWGGGRGGEGLLGTALGEMILVFRPSERLEYAYPPYLSPTMTKQR